MYTKCHNRISVNYIPLMQCNNIDIIEGTVYNISNNPAIAICLLDMFYQSQICSYPVVYVLVNILMELFLNPNKTAHVSYI